MANNLVSTKIYNNTFHTNIISTAILTQQWLELFGTKHRTPQPNLKTEEVTI